MEMLKKVDNRAIGLFDSGVGGLTVVNSVLNYLPKENIIYIGDNKNSPYGNKSKEDLYLYASRIIEYFIENNVKLIVLACNTTSANILNKLQTKYYNIPIIGVIESTVHDFISKNLKKPLIIATEATINSNKYASTIKLLKPEVQPISLATPKLVPLIESGKYKEGIYDVLHEYLDDYKGKVDSIILGCTHYPVLKNQIEIVLPKINYVSSSEAIGLDTMKYLVSNNLLGDNKKPKISIYTTGNVDDFKYSSSNFFDYSDLAVEHLDI